MDRKKKVGMINMDDIFELVKEYREYRKSENSAIFFLFIDGQKYTEICNKLLCQFNWNKIKVSNFCKEADRFPSIDELDRQIKNTNKDLLVLGLGEYIGLRGWEVGKTILTKLRGESVKQKVVLLLRGIQETLIEYLKKDLRFEEQGSFYEFYASDKKKYSPIINLVSPAISCYPQALDGFKALLNEIEASDKQEFIVKTSQNFNESYFTVIPKINSAYDALKINFSALKLQRDWGDDDNWETLLKELEENNKSLEKVFEKYDYYKNLESNFYDKCLLADFKGWLYFIALKVNYSKLDNSYLKCVLDMSNSLKKLRFNFLNEIININHTDKKFEKFYHDRKILLKDFQESDMFEFINNNRKEVTESIYKLTDKTRLERQEIIKQINRIGLTQEIEKLIEKIYPALSNYLQSYPIDAGDNSQLLTNYFNAYKKQKVENKIDENFLEIVNEQASKRQYNNLPTMDKIIYRSNKDETFLIWIDALGIEYLAYIAELAKKFELSISVDIARAQLPTITENNKSFYDDWANDKKKKYDFLDVIKHDGEKFGHIVDELDVIEKCMRDIAFNLLNKYKLVVIASDHGASRLAVLHKSKRYEMNTKGEHYGRCCKEKEVVEGEIPKNATKENGYIILADYGMFKGGRAGNVEVHGGASLEEVVVPVIEIKRAKNEKLKIYLLDEKNIFADAKEGLIIKFSLNYICREIYWRFNEKDYAAVVCDDNQHFEVKIPDIKRSGKYVFNVFVDGLQSDDDIVVNVGAKGLTINDILPEEDL
jgi:hypothetical protein